MVVREENTAVAHLPFDPQIPFAPLFCAFTVLIPLAYLYYDMRSHDRLLLVVDLLAMAFSVFTLRYYRTLLPPAVAATQVGPLLLAALPAHPTHGLTAAADDEAPPRFNLETVVIARANGPRQFPPQALHSAAGSRAATVLPPSGKRQTLTGWYSLANCATA